MTGVVIGRFQVPYLHLGHIYLIASVLQKYGSAAILLGTSDKRDEKNPYSIAHRIDIIHRIFSHIHIHTLYDCPDDDQKWSTNIDFICNNIGGEIVLCHSRDSFKDHYKGSIPLEEIPELQGYSGTELRKQHKPWSDKEV